MPADELAAGLPAPSLDHDEPVSGDARRKRRLRIMAKEHLPKVWRFLRRLGLGEADADDGMQEVVLVALRRIDDIDPERELSFLLGTAYRVGARMRARRPKRSEREVEDLIPHPDVLVDQKRARELLDEILERMSTDLRTVFVLHDIEGLTMAEIADVLELNPGTVASRLRRAREDFDRRVARIEARIKPREVMP